MVFLYDVMFLLAHDEKSRIKTSYSKKSIYYIKNPIVV